jgi:hypothetical protein
MIRSGMRRPPRASYRGAVCGAAAAARLATSVACATARRAWPLSWNRAIRAIAAGRRERDRLAAGRKHHERAGLRAAHPHVRDRAVVLDGQLDQFEPQVGKREMEPRAGGHEARHAGPGAGRRLVGGHVVDVPAAPTRRW